MKNFKTGPQRSAQTQTDFFDATPNEDQLVAQAELIPHALQPILLRDIEKYKSLISNMKERIDYCKHEEWELQRKQIAANELLTNMDEIAIQKNKKRIKQLKAQAKKQKLLLSQLEAQLKEQQCINSSLLLMTLK